MNGLATQEQGHLFEFDLATLADIPAGEQIQRLIERAIEDIDRRPGDSGWRTIPVNIRIRPVTRLEVDNDRGISQTVLTGVKIAITSNLVLPKYGPVEYDAGLSGKKILINPQCPGDHRQRMLPVMDGQILPIQESAVG